MTNDDYSLGFENVWLEKTKYDDAEVKHYKRLANQPKKSSNESKMIGKKKMRRKEYCSKYCS